MTVIGSVIGGNGGFETVSVVLVGSLEVVDSYVVVWSVVVSGVGWIVIGSVLIGAVVGKGEVVGIGKAVISSWGGGGVHCHSQTQTFIKLNIIKFFLKNHRKILPDNQKKIVMDLGNVKQKIIQEPVHIW